MPIFHSAKDRRTVFIHWKVLTPISRTLGLLTSAVLFGVGIDQCYHQHALGIYVIFLATCIFSLEISWLVILFVKLQRIDNAILDKNRYWNTILYATRTRNLWKKSVAYLLASVMLFTKPHKPWLCKIAGIQLIALAGVYTLMSAQHYLMNVYTHKTKGYHSRYEHISLDFREEDETGYEKLSTKYQEEAADEPEVDPTKTEILDIDQDPLLKM